MLNRDHIRFQHMLDAAQSAISHLAEHSREDLDNDRLFLNGIVRELEILGEAASQISHSTQKQYSDLPWKEMIGMRNHLIHAYFDINKNTVWLVVKESLPPLVKQLQKILADWPSTLSK